MEFPMLTSSNNMQIGQRVQVTHTILGTEEPMVGEITHIFDGTIEIRAEHDGKIHGPFFFHEATKLPKKSWNFQNEQNITRERLRQMRLKMRRQATKINKLERELDRIYAEVEQVVETGKKGDGTTAECEMVYRLDDLLTDLKKKYYSVY